MNHPASVMSTLCNSAIMLSQGQLAGHFSRAGQLQILTPEGEIVATLPNPAAAPGCAGKKALLEALTHHQVGRVIVRNIGERMLDRLLTANIRVMRCHSARLPLPALLDPANMLPMTGADQGRPSRRHHSQSAIRAIQPATLAHGQCAGQTCSHDGQGADQQCGGCHHHKEQKSCQSGC